MNSIDFSRVYIQHDPLALHRADHNDLAVWREGGGLRLLADIVAPDHRVAQCVPQMNHSEIKISDVIFMDSYYKYKYSIDLLGCYSIDCWIFFWPINIYFITYLVCLSICNA